MYWGFALLLTIAAFVIQLMLCLAARRTWQRILGLLLPAIALVSAGVLWILLYTVDTELYLFGTHFLFVWVFALIAAAAFTAGCGAAWLLWLFCRKNRKSR